MRSSAKTRSTQQTEPTRVAAVHELAQGYALVVLERRGAAVALTTASTHHNEAALKAELDKHRGATILRVLPGDAAVCRIIEVPDGPEPELIDALALLAEVQLPPDLPPHRRAAGVVDLLARGQRSTGAMRPCLLSGWRETLYPDHQFSDAEHWTSEAAALLSLMGLADRADTHATAMRADATTGAITLLATSPAKCIVRCIREDATNPSAFTAAALNALHEIGGDTTTPSANLDADAVQLRIPEAVRRALTTRISGARDTADWLSQFAIPLGAATGALRASPASAGLFRMLAEPPKLELPPVERCALWLSKPRNRAALIVAALIIAIGAPVASALVRASRLEAKNETYRAQLNAYATALGINREGDAAMTVDQLRTLYAELSVKRWPMTKLLADAAAALPATDRSTIALAQEIDIEVGRGVSIRGTATSFDLITEFQSALTRSGVFRDVITEQADLTDSGLVEFQVVGKVARAYDPAKELPDYNEANIAQRFYGDNATMNAGSTQLAANTSPSTPSPSRGARNSGSSPRSATPSAAADTEAKPAANRPRFEGGSRETAAEPQAVPDPLSDEDIEALDSLGAMKERIARQRAARAADISPEDKTRLEEEAEKLRDRAQRAKEEG